MPTLSPATAATGTMSAATAGSGSASTVAPSSGTEAAAVIEHIGAPLYPLDTLFPSDSLYPADESRGFAALIAATGSLSPA